MTIRNLLLLLTLGCAAAHADIVQIALDSIQITASAGGSVTFSGVITNNASQTVDLNNLSLSLPGMFELDNSPFFFGPISVAGNSQTGDFGLFTVTVDEPYSDPYGPVMGTLTVLGGIETNGYNPNTQSYLGSTTFAVDVEAPEPSGLVLILAAVILATLSLLLRSLRHIKTDASCR